MNVRELIDALGDLDPTLPVAAEIVDTGEEIPIDVVAVVGTDHGDIAMLRPLEDWQATAST